MVKSLRQYAKEYGVSHETIRKLKDEGIDLENRDLVRDRLERGGKGNTGRNQGGRHIPQSGEEKGLGRAIERLQGAEVAAHADYQAALELGDDILAARRLKEWALLVESLRKLEDTNPKVDLAKKESVPLSELATVLGDLFKELRGDLESLPQRVAVECAGKDEIGIREIVGREVGGIINNLFECSYLGDGWNG